MHSGAHPVFLNEIFTRFTKLHLFRKLMRGMVPAIDESDQGTAPMSLTKLGKIEQIFTRAEAGLKTAAPYQFLPATTEYICGKSDARLSSDAMLPFPTTWIDNCTGEKDTDIKSGALLQDPGKGKIAITLFFSQPQPASLPPTFEPGEFPLNMSRIRALEHHEFPLLIVPNITFDRDAGRIISPESQLMPLLQESGDFMPLILDYAQAIKTWDIPADIKILMKENHLRAAEMALLLCQAVTRKEQHLSVDIAPKTKRENESFAVKLGRPPTRTPNVVKIDLDALKKVPAASEDSIFSEYQKARHWVQAYEYTRRDGRVIKVREHERYKSSSPVPAPYKPRIVKGGSPKDIPAAPK